MVFVLELVFLGKIGGRIMIFKGKFLNVYIKLEKIWFYENKVINLFYFFNLRIFFV